MQTDAISPSLVRAFRGAQEEDAPLEQILQAIVEAPDQYSHSSHPLFSNIPVVPTGNQPGDQRSSAYDSNVGAPILGQRLGESANMRLVNQDA